jgi:hypothetical protein
VEVLASDFSDRNTTRRISAAMYYDQAQAHAVLDLVGERSHGFIVNHDGVNNTVVASHAAAAFSRWNRHNATVVGVATAAMALLLLTLDEPALALFALPLIFFYVLGIRIAIGMVRLTTRLLYGRDQRRLGLVGLIVAAGAAFVIFRLGIPLIVPLAAAFVTEAVLRSRTYLQIIPRFRPGVWEEKRAEVSYVPLQQLVDQVEKTAATGNATVYSGYTPFVGSGYRLGGENGLAFALELMADDRPGAVTPQGIPEEVVLTDALRSYVASLELPETDIRRWHFVEGTTAPDVPGMIPEGSTRPIGAVDGRLVSSGEMSDEIIRPYLWISGRRWAGDIVINTYVRLNPRATTLFVEITHHVALPLEPQYDRCDLPFDNGSWSLWKSVLKESAVGLLAMPSSLWWSATRSWRWNRASRELQQVASMGLRPDYGAESSVRELFQAADFDHYFQAIDTLEQRQVLDTHLLRALDESLKRFGYRLRNLDIVVQGLTQNVTNNSYSQTFNNSSLSGVNNMGGVMGSATGGAGGTGAGGGS